MPWLSEQIFSIEKQNDVDVELFFSDDGSIDGSFEYINSLQSVFPIHVLMRESATGSATLNFFRLIRDVDFSGFDYIFLSDQDDIWHSSKIIKAIEFMLANDAECYASNLICTYENGDRKLLRKDYPQTQNDFLFQSASAGCTYGLKINAANEVQRMLTNLNFSKFKKSSHDWIIYAFTRSVGFRWCIDPVPYIDYRQHPNNVWGALGFISYLKRWRMLRNGWYRMQILSVAEICKLKNEQKKIISHINEWSIKSRFKLMFLSFSFRRGYREKAMIALLILFGAL